VHWRRKPVTAIRRFALAFILFQTCFVFLAAADDQKACFYLDKKEIPSTIVPVFLVRVGTLDKKISILLDMNGLFEGDERRCQWSLNGGSGTKEQFSLDGNFAVPILDTVCETPFSHEYTGVGFGDWYVTLCGLISGGNLYVNYREDKYYVSVESLIQWTRYTPQEFPVKGDKGY
jgi:hypothetical protein